MKITDKHIELVRQALGLYHMKADKAFKNHYIAGFGHESWDQLIELCDIGCMERRDYQLYDDSYVFMVTELGRELLNG